MVFGLSGWFRRDGSLDEQGSFPHDQDQWIPVRAAIPVELLPAADKEEPTPEGFRFCLVFTPNQVLFGWL